MFFLNGLLMCKNRYRYPGHYVCSIFVLEIEKFHLYFFWCEQDLWAGAEPIWRLALLCYQRHWLSQIAGKWCHLWAVSAVDLGYIPLTSRVNAKAMEKKKPQDRGMLWEEQVHVWWSACQWSTKPHKSSSITSDGRKGWVAPRPSPQPSHSHVYLPVIHALEQRLLMPCLWFITYHVLHRFSQWGDPKQMRKNKAKQASLLAICSG